MKLSNDVKWNKIKAIEIRLIPLYAKYVYQNAAKGKEVAHKIASTKLWILANQIYDIATEGWEDESPNFYYHHWSKTVIAKDKVIELANDFAKRYYFDPKLVRYQIDQYWYDYEYTNS